MTIMRVYGLWLCALVLVVVAFVPLDNRSVSAWLATKPTQHSRHGYGSSTSSSSSRLFYETKTTVAPIFDEVCDTTGVTLKRFMSEVAMLNPELDEIKVLFGAIETACKAITNLVKRSQLPSSETLGYSVDDGSMNQQQGGGGGGSGGDNQRKLDVLCNDILKRALRFTGRLGVLASEEDEAPMSLQGGGGGGKDVLIDAGTRYCAVFDPLDGSSNVDAGIPTGTIIGESMQPTTYNG